MLHVSAYSGPSTGRTTTKTADVTHELQPAAWLHVNSNGTGIPGLGFSTFSWVFFQGATIATLTPKNFHHFPWPEKKTENWTKAPGGYTRS